MDRDTFHKLYAAGERRHVDRHLIALGMQAQIDWDTFDNARDSFDPHRVIGREEAAQDVRQLFVLLEYAYSGYEYHAQYTDFGLLQLQFAEKIAKWPDPEIACSEFCRLLHGVLYEYINDGHVSLAYAGFDDSLIHSCLPYVSDVILEERACSYAVIRGCKGLEPGRLMQRSAIRAELYPTLMPGRMKNCYLAGCYSPADPEAIEIGGIYCRTHLLKCCRKRDAAGKLYELTEDGEYCIFRNPSFQIYEDGEQHRRRFNEAGKKCAGKKAVIWDLSGNRGGDSAYAEAFLRGLNGYVQTEMDTAVLCSPLTGRSEADVYYRTDKAPATEDAGTFDGTLYVVTNKETGSSAENGLTFARSCKNVVTVGAPSAGVGLFGEVRPYRLTNSGILVTLPYKVFYEDGFVIGKGKFPNFLIDEEDPAAYILRCL